MKNSLPKIGCANPEDIVCECGHIKERHGSGTSEFWNESTDSWEYCEEFKEKDK